MILYEVLLCKAGGARCPRVTHEKAIGEHANAGD
jgi:hypothetical protein